MAEERLLTVRDVSFILGVSEKEVVDLAENGALPTYRIGGVYLRFKRKEIEEFKKTPGSLVQRVGTRENSFSQSPAPAQRTFKEKLNDFFYFNDFYIFSFLIIFLILAVIFLY